MRQEALEQINNRPHTKSEDQCPNAAGLYESGEVDLWEQQQTSKDDAAKIGQDPIDAEAALLPGVRNDEGDGVIRRYALVGTVIHCGREAQKQETDCKKNQPLCQADVRKQQVKGTPDAVNDMTLKQKGNNSPDTDVMSVKYSGKE